MTETVKKLDTPVELNTPYTYFQKEYGPRKDLYRFNVSIQLDGYEVKDDQITIEELRSLDKHENEYRVCNPAEPYYNPSLVRTRIVIPLQRLEGTPY